MKLDPAKLHMMPVDKAVEAYTVGGDCVLDLKLVEADCLGSAGHAAGLAKIGILSPEELASLKAGLKEIVEFHRKGEFEIRREQEDVHTAIEAYLTQTRGEVGKKIHTARSRNDQVVCATRLYAKWELIRTASAAIRLARSAAGFAERHRETPMVGRTHMQKAMPSSVGLWMGALSEALVDDLALLWAAYHFNDQCPLGSAASYGVPVELDRSYVSRLLGFGRLQNNCLYAANSRGKIEAAVLAACVQIMLDLSRYAQDFMLFSMPEFGYFTIPQDFCTGSSLMPQKRNPCVLELVRAKAASVIAAHGQAASIVRALPTGYNRDGQETKGPFMAGLETTRASLEILDLVLGGIEVHKEKLTGAFTPEVFATDRALELVASGAPFRDAYREVKENLDKLGEVDPREAIRKKKHAGAPSNLGLELVTEALEGHSSRTSAEAEKARASFEGLLGLSGPSALVM